jgi:hypothetical protein
LTRRDLHRNFRFTLKELNMRNSAISAGAIAAMLIASPAFADDTAPPKKDKSQQIVCKTDQYVGSHISQRICKTRAEWDEAAKQSQQFLDQRRAMGPGERPKYGG